MLANVVFFPAPASATRDTCLACVDDADDVACVNGRVEGSRFSPRTIYRAPLLRAAARGALRFAQLLALGGALLGAQSTAAKIDEIVVEVPFNVSLGEESSVAELGMTCKLYLLDDEESSFLADGTLAVPEAGSVSGAYAFRFERATGVNRVERDQRRTTNSVPRAFLDRFESGVEAGFNCRWSTVRHEGASAAAPIDTQTSYAGNGEIVRTADAGRVIFSTDGSTGSPVELNDDSVVFFNMTFSAADNQLLGSPREPTLVANAPGTSGKYAGVGNLPGTNAGLPDASSIENSDEIRSAPGSASAATADDNGPLRIRVEAANVCVTKSDDWGLNGSNEDVSGRFYATLELQTKDGSTAVETLDFVSGNSAAFEVGPLYNTLYRIPASDRIEIGEASCAGRLAQVGEFLVFPIEHGYGSLAQMKSEGNVRLVVGGRLSDYDPRLFWVTPSVPRNVYTNSLSDLPICGTCSSGPGTAKTDNWSVLTSKRPGPINGVMGFPLGDDPSGAFGQWHYNIEIVSN